MDTDSRRRTSCPGYPLLPSQYYLHWSALFIEALKLLHRNMSVIMATSPNRGAGGEAEELNTASVWRCDGGSGFVPGCQNKIHYVPIHSTANTSILQYASQPIPTHNPLHCRNMSKRVRVQCYEEVECPRLMLPACSSMEFVKVKRK